VLTFLGQAVMLMPRTAKLSVITSEPFNKPTPQDKLMMQTLL